MSGLFVDFWLNSLITEEQIKQIDTVVHACGDEVSSTRKLWQDEFKHVSKINNERPIDVMQKRTKSANLQSALREINKNNPIDPQALASIAWGFLFSDASMFTDAPDPANYSLPYFGISIEQQAFRLLVPWGTTAYHGDKAINEEMQRLEVICDQIGYMPIATGLIVSKFPYDCVLAGFLSVELLRILDCRLLLALKGSSEALEHVYEQVTAGDFPGSMQRLLFEYKDYQGELATYTQYLVDLEFLQAWMKHPSYTLY